MLNACVSGQMNRGDNLRAGSRFWNSGSTTQHVGWLIKCAASLGLGVLPILSLPSQGWCHSGNWWFFWSPAHICCCFRPERGRGCWAQRRERWACDDAMSHSLSLNTRTDSRQSKANKLNKACVISAFNKQQNEGQWKSCQSKRICTQQRQLSRQSQSQLIFGY